MDTYNALSNDNYHKKGGITIDKIFKNVYEVNKESIGAGALMRIIPLAIWAYNLNN